MDLQINLELNRIQLLSSHTAKLWVSFLCSKNTPGYTEEAKSNILYFYFKPTVCLDSPTLVSLY